MNILLNILNDVVPIGTKDWKEVEWRHRQHYPDLGAKHLVFPICIGFVASMIALLMFFIEISTEEMQFLSTVQVEDMELVEMYEKLGDAWGGSRWEGLNNDVKEWAPRKHLRISYIFQQNSIKKDIAYLKTNQSYGLFRIYFICTDDAWWDTSETKLSVCRICRCYRRKN